MANTESYGVGIESGKNKNIYNIVNPEFCKQLKAKYPELDKYNIEKVMMQFGSYLVDVMGSNRGGIELPYFIGAMFIGAFPTRINKFSLARALNEKTSAVYNIQERDGFEPRLFFFRNKNNRARSYFAKFWGFYPNCSIKSKVLKIFKVSWKYFICVHNTRFMDEVFRTPRKKKEILNEQLKTYDEFKFEQ